ncbi:F-box protein [Carex littledalei]|uniref:F-box protein n=1 Tax=Carex littledalei TaxID=544730 RepID=A0A833RH44_9POAL|nr:F-box protein [Carex littledalei]
MAPLPSSESHKDLPHHLVHENILPHLPFKYLNRLKCISKELHSLISTDAKFSTDQSRSVDTSSNGFVYMRDGVLSFFPDPALVGVPDPSLNFLNPTSFYDKIMLVSCTNGLLLLHGEFSRKESLCVCNPATKEMVFVPKSFDRDLYFVNKMGLAYDPCELPDRFTIVYPLLDHNRDGHLYRFNVFCSDTGKWTLLRTSVYLGSYSIARKPVCAKGVIYWCCTKHLLWYDTKKDLGGYVMLPAIEEKIHVGVNDGEITYCRAWVGGIEVWKLTGGSRWDKLHAASWDGMLDVVNFCHDMQLCCKSQSELFFMQHIIFPVGFDGQFVYITVRQKKDGINKSRFFRWETETARAEEKDQIIVWEPWLSNQIFKYANSMARVPQILNGTS